MENTYDTVELFWPITPASPSVDIYINERQLLARFPLQFLTTASCASWGYILDVCRNLVNEDGDIVPASLATDDAVRCRDQAVAAGEYVYKGTGRCLLLDCLPCNTAAPLDSCHTVDIGPISYCSGPEGKHRFRPPRSSGSSETMSNSRRSTANQVSQILSCTGLTAPEVVD
jgi:hypothetical protein